MYENTPEIKARLTTWRDELRKAHREGSPQTTGVLCRLEDRLDVQAGRCCLGVAADLAVTAGRLTTRQNRDVVIYIDNETTPGVLAGDSYVAEDSSELPRNEAKYLGFGTHGDPILLHVETPDGRTAYLRGHDPYDPDFTGEDIAEPISLSAATLNDGIKLSFDQIADCMTWNFGLEG